MLRFASVVLMVLVAGWSSFTEAQPIPSSEGSNVEYQYQLHYRHPWLGYPGPGVSLGGSLPEQGRDGISSLYGLPFPAPLGLGVYGNPPLGYRHSAVGPFWYGPGPGMFPPQLTPYPVPWSANRSPASTGSVAQAARERSLQRSVTPAIAKVDRQPSLRPSSEEAKQQSLELQDRGDEMLRSQRWSEACVSYRNAVDLAEDRAEARFRLGFAYIATKHFTLAVRQFKRGLDLDPSLAQSGESLATIFGPDSQPTRASIQHQIATWVREDIRDSDRLFLLGLWLHYADDSRGDELLEAALHIAGEGDHLIAFLTPSVVPASAEEQDPLAVMPDLPMLHSLPMEIDDAELDIGDLPPPPLPSQDIFP